LQVKPEGFDPVFDVIPSQTYKDFYLEVIRGHPTLKHLNVFEVIDTALNQIRAPEYSGVDDLDDFDDFDSIEDILESAGPARAGDHPRLVEVKLERLPPDDLVDYGPEADTA